MITPIIAGIFGGVMILVVLGFLIIIRRTGRLGFDSQDFLKGGRKQPRQQQSEKRTNSSTSYSSYSSRWDRSSNEQNQYGAEKGQRNIAILVISLAVVAILISSLFNSIDGLLLIFILPIVVRFLRVRRGEGSRRRAPDSGDSNSSV